MPIGTSAAIAAGIGAAGSIGSSVISSRAQGKAAETQANAAAEAARIRQQAGKEAVGLQEPYKAAGEIGLKSLMDLPDFQAPTVTDDPGYQFRLEQGQQALERSAAARGGLLSGGTVKATERYAQGQASQEYQNAYDRAMREYALRYGKAYDLTGLGERAATRSGAYLVGSAQDVGQLGMQGAEAQASGYGAWAPTVSTVGQSVADIILAEQARRNATNRYDMPLAG